MQNDDATKAVKVQQDTYMRMSVDDNKQLYLDIHKETEYVFDS